MNVEKLLRQHWNSLLGPGHIDTHADFCQLGGDALLFKALKQNLQKDFFKRALTIDQGFPTQFDQQVDYIKQKLNLPRASIITELQTGDVSLTWVMVHPIGGTLFSFYPLVQALATPQRILGIQDPVLQQDFRHFQTIKAQAQYYAEQLLPHIQNAQLIIAGYSSGGTVGCELSRLLQQQDINVLHLILFDSWAVMPFGLSFRNHFKSIILRQLQKIRPQAYLGQQYLDHWLETLWNRMRLVLSYQPQPLNINATVFIPKIAVSEYQVAPEAYNRWRTLFKQVTLQSVDGSHESMLDEVDITPIAQYCQQLEQKLTEG